MEKESAKKTVVWDDGYGHSTIGLSMNCCGICTDSQNC